MKNKNKFTIIGIICLFIVISLVCILFIQRKNNVNNINFVNRKEVNKISIGDEISIGSEHFYVINSNDNKTSLLSKYNLYSGFILDIKKENECEEEGYISDPEYPECYINETEVFNKEITSSDNGYGLQNKNALGYNENANQLIGVVPFSEAYYWWYSDNIKEPANFETNSMNDIYDKTLNKVAPKINSDFESVNDWINETNYAPNYDGYSIAYYVEGYVDKLKTLGAPSNISGRLLKRDEAISLGCNEKIINSEINAYKEGSCSKNNSDEEESITGNAYPWVFSSSYWLGSADMSGSHSNGIDFTRVYVIDASGNFSSSYYTDYNYGIRPVIDIDTAYLE